jgi:4-amino-4-deoxy-L-arabinose transferase-like glycosyltransferase
VRAILVPLFAALTCYYLWRGLRRQARQDFIVCGVVLGLSLYTYQAARLLPVLVVLGFGYYLGQQRAFSRQDVVNFSIVVLVSLVVFAPLGHYFLTHPGSFSERIRQAFVIQPSYDAATRVKALAQQFIDVLLIFGVRGDKAPYSTISGRPALNPFFAGLWLIGMVVSLVNGGRPHDRGFYKRAFVVTWWAVMLIPASVAAKAPAAKRAIGSLPAVALLVAIGRDSLTRGLRALLANYTPPPCCREC